MLFSCSLPLHKTLQMKNFLLCLLLISTIFSCKQSENKEQVKIESQSVQQKIASANCIDNWKYVKEIQFTFNVDRDTTHFERAWTWNPKTDDVTLRTAQDTVIYNRKFVDSSFVDADKAFINDKFWMLAPFQLVWDTSATVSDPKVVEAPISKLKLNKITLTYPNEGGYTPGDAYDFFYDDNFMVKEWNYRKGNADTPTISTSWEDYEGFNGIKISKTHQKPNEKWKLYFTAIKVVKE